MQEMYRSSSHRGYKTVILLNAKMSLKDLHKLLILFYPYMNRCNIFEAILFHCNAIIIIIIIMLIWTRWKQICYDVD